MGSLLGAWLGGENRETSREGERYLPSQVCDSALDQHDALCPRRISAVEHAQQKALVRPCVALTVLGVDFPHDLDEAPQTSPR
jgi:hypothetical protein